MPAKFEYDARLNVLHAWPCGEISFQDVLSFFEEVLNQKSLNSGFIEVVHFDNVENFLFSNDEASRIARQYNGYKEKKKIIATIFVGVKPIHFGMARMMQSLFEINTSGHPIFSVNDNQELEDLIYRIIKDN